ncbi:MAG: PAS domain S-box protein [Promethearchaeota archaeon]
MTSIEKKLKESEERFRALFKGGPIPTYTWQKVGDSFKLIDFNNAAEKITRGNINKFLGIYASDMYKDRPDILKDLSDCFNNQTNIIREMKNLFSTFEEEKNFLVAYSYIPHDLVLVHTEDITERKNAEQKLKESEEKYRSLFNNMNAGFAYHKVIVDEKNNPIDYEYIEVNPAFEKLTGLKAEQMIGKRVTEILPGTENDPADWIGKFGNVGLTGVPLTVEDYSEAIGRWYKVSGYSPKKGYFAVTFTDITKQKNSEEKTAKSEEKYRNLFNSVPFAILLFNIEGTILDCNDATSLITGYSREDLIGKNFKDFNFYVDISSANIEIRESQVKNGKLPSTRDILLFKKDGSQFWARNNLRFVTLQNETYLQAIIQDITEEKLTRIKLNESENLLKERVKELNCLYKLSMLDDKLNISSKEIITKALKIIQSAWQHPKITCVRIVFEDEEYTTENFNETKEQLKTCVKINDKAMDIEVYYLEDKSFLDEEKDLLKDIGIRIKGILERKESDAILELEKAFTEDIMNSSMDTIFVFETETGKAIRWNKVFSDVSGYSDDEIFSMKAPDSYYSKEDLQRASEATKDVLKKGKTTIEMILITKEGQKIPYEYTGTLLKSPDGKPLIVSVGRDISERKQAEIRLKESEEKFRTITEQSLVGIAVLQDGVFKYFNEKIVEINGYSAEEMKSWTPDELPNLFHPEDREFVMEQALKKQKGDPDVVNQYTFRIIRKDGEIRWCEIFSKTIDYEGAPADLVMTYDITDKIKAEQNLKESEEKFRTIAEQSLVGIVVIQDGVFKYFNDKIVEINGYSPEEIKSWAPNEFAKVFHPEDREFVMEQAHKKQTGDPDVVKQYIYRAIRKDGEVRWLENFSKTIDYEGAPADLAMVYDITEKIKAEQDLKESEEKFRNIADQSLIGISVLQDGVFKYVNEKIDDIYGYSAEEMKSWAPNVFAKLVYHEDREFVMEQALKKQKGDPDVINQYPFRIIRKDGEIRWLEIFSKTINYEGAPADLAMSYDITDKIKAEQNLKESEEKFRTITEQSLMGIFILQDGKFKYINERLAEMNGYSVEEMKSWAPYEQKKLIHPDDREFVIEQLQKKQKGDPDVINQYTYRIIKKDGEIRWREIFSKTIMYEGAPADLAITTDITDKIKAEQKLKDSEKKYKEAFDRANFYKDLFVHDINNILQVVNSSAELISYQLDDSEKCRDIENIARIISKQVDRGSKLVSNIRTLSKLEEEQIPKNKLEISRFLENSIDFVKNAFEDKNVKISIEPLNGKYNIEANELIQDVFENIIINAIKYNENPNIEISIRLSKIKKDKINYVKIEFIDNGMGIPDDRKKSIFLSGHREFKGSKGMGLGLSLVNKIIQIFDGKIWVEDRVKGDYTQGSNFIILLPKV